MLIFTHPWLFLLLPVPLLMRWLLPAYRQAKIAVQVSFLDRLTRLTGIQPAEGSALSRRHFIQWFLLLFCWLAIVAALARPQWLEDPIVRELPMRDLLVAVDLSGSMDTQDFTDAQGAVTDRLTAAKQVLDEFFTSREGDRVGLILFGTGAFVQVPFTQDIDVIRELLAETQSRMLGPRTMLGDAMGLAINLFERSEVDDRILIVLTDGNDTGSMIPPERAAEIARDSGVVVHTIAMGDPKAVGEQALDEAVLIQVAEITGGKYFHAADRHELEDIYIRLDELNPRQVESISYRPQRDLYFWPLGAVLILSLLFFTVADFRSRTRHVIAQKPPGTESPA